MALTPQALNFLATGASSPNVPKTTIPPGGPFATAPTFNGTVQDLYELLWMSVYGGTLYTSDTSSQTVVGRIVVLEQQVNNYFASAQFYQQNVEALTQALTDVNGGDEKGNNTLNFTLGVLQTTFIQTITSPTQTVVFSSVVFSETVVRESVQDLVRSFGGSLNTDSASSVALSVNGQTINALISTQQNNLSNEQTFLNSAVNTVQSETSLVGTILNSITNAISGVISDIS